MDGSLWTVLLVIAGVGIGAWLLRSLSGSVKSAPSLPQPPERRPEGDPVEALLADVLGESDAGGAPAVAVLTSDGWAFVPDGEEVHLVPPGDPEDVLPVRSDITTGRAPSTDPDIQVMDGRGAPVNPKTGRRVTNWKPGEHLDAGDLIAARIKRGAPDYDPWRLEALGRDREYRAWRFETEEAVRAAYDLVAQRIVRPLRDRDGEPIPIGEADYAEARRIEEETEAALDDEDGPRE